MKHTSWYRIALPMFAMAASAFWSAAAAFAQGSDAYPNKPIRLLVGFAAGGVADTTARLLAQGLSERLHQPVIIDSRPGAGGNIAARVVALAAPDGYTLLLGSSSLPTNFAAGGQPLVDPSRDLLSIAPLAATPFAVVSSPDKGYTTLPQLIEAASRNPGKLSYGSNGAGALNHFIVAALTAMAKVDILHVPYKGGSQQLTAVLVKEVDFGLITMPTSLPLLRERKLAAIAVTSERRASQLPQTPTLAEAGFAGAGAENWLALFAPRQLSAALAEKVERETTAVMTTPRLMEVIHASGSTLMTGGSSALADLVKKETAKWQSVAASGLGK